MAGQQRLAHVLPAVPRCIGLENKKKEGTEMPKVKGYLRKVKGSSKKIRVKGYTRKK